MTNHLIKPRGMKHYCESRQAWLIVLAKNARRARSYARASFGRGNTDVVRQATSWEVENYLSQFGSIEEADD